MLKKIVVSSLIIGFSIFIIFKLLQFKKSNEPDKIKQTPYQQILAVYDNKKQQVAYFKDSVLHYTISWFNSRPTSIPKKELAKLFAQELPLYLNLEIWPRELIKNLDKNTETFIIAGEYDRKLTDFFTLLTAAKKTVYLSYNPEMEVPIYKYPWQSKSCDGYILSFRHIATLAKKIAPDVKIVWAPAGYSGTEEYWPGNEYVDFSAVNLTMIPEVNNDPFPAFTTTKQMISRKIFRMRFMEKPVLLLATQSVNRTKVDQQLFTSIEAKIKTDSAIYHSPVIPIVTDMAVVKPARTANLKIGVYDPKLLLTNQPLVTVEHIFTDIRSVENGFFKKEFEQVIDRHHDVIVTIEPWKTLTLERDSNILQNTLDGKYDNTLKKLYQIISNIPQTVYLRWGHEMEIPVDRYPWQKQDPVTYIKAFRYVANFEENRAPNIKIVWGPTGDRGCVEYWPGDDVVDYVSIAIYGLPDKNINDHTKQHSFSSIFSIKSHRIRFAKKPIFITEFGVKGPQDYKKKWLEDAASTINKNPQIVGINYFSFSDTPKAWGNAETPDWSITPNTFESFTGLLKDLPKK
jgi:beta-mannanase